MHLTFMSKTTWVNLQLCVCGFISYSEYIVNKYESVYVLMLFSNTSFIEATFAHIRSLGGRDAATFKT